jgi:hypothetical protein
MLPTEAGRSYSLGQQETADYQPAPKPLPAPAAIKWVWGHGWSNQPCRQRIGAQVDETQAPMREMIMNWRPWGLWGLGRRGTPGAGVHAVNADDRDWFQALRKSANREDPDCVADSVSLAARMTTA